MKFSVALRWKEEIPKTPSPGEYYIAPGTNSRNAVARTSRSHAAITVIFLHCSLASSVKLGISCWCHYCQLKWFKWQAGNSHGYRRASVCGRSGVEDVCNAGPWGLRNSSDHNWQQPLDKTRARDGCGRTRAPDYLQLQQRGLEQAGTRQYRSGNVQDRP